MAQKDAPMTASASQNYGQRGSKGRTVRHSRRRFLAVLSSAGAAGSIGSYRPTFGAESPKSARQMAFQVAWVVAGLPWMAATMFSQIALTIDSIM